MSTRTNGIVAAALMALTVSGILIAQPAPEADAGNPPPPPSPSEPIKGVVKSMNLTADGEANGLLIQVGEGPLTQVNFPPHLAAQIGKAVKPGTAITVATRPLPPKGRGPEGQGPRGPRPPRPEDADRPAPPPPPADAAKADHPVAELVSLTPDGGTEIKVVRPDEMPTKHVEGKIAALNYTREGQPDGAILDNGTFVHVGPKEMADLGLKAGDTVMADGMTPGRAAANVIHATSVNGTKIERPAPGPKGPGGPKGPKGPPAP